LDDLPITPKKKLPTQKQGESPFIHSVCYPLPKQEKWIAVLIEYCWKQCAQCHAKAVCHCPTCNLSLCVNCDLDKHKRLDKLRKRDSANADDDDDEPHVNFNNEHQRIALMFQRIAAVQKIPNFDAKEEVQLRFKPPICGKYSYELWVRCDSYIGCDIQVKFDLLVEKPREDEKKKRNSG